MEINYSYISPAAMAAATRLTEEQFRDVYQLASFLDNIAEEARASERTKIFNMNAVDLIRLFWEGKKLYRKNDAFSPK
jgi:hypothetical protein